MRRAWSSLRVRLAVTGFVSVYVPVLILFGVVAATSVEEQSVGEQGTVSVESSEPGTDPWVIATAIILAPVAAAVSWWWAGRAVKPLADISDTIKAIDGGSLERRVDLRSGPIEVVELAGSFDEMLDRLHAAADLQRKLIEDTSHELRTPLAVLGTNAEVALAQPEPTLESYADALRRSQATARRLATIIDELLVDARGRARSIERSPADLMMIVRDVVEAVRSLAEAKGVKIAVDGPAELLCSVDTPSVSRAVRNLVDNGVQHGGSGRRVDVAVQQREGEAVISVTDRGPGIAEDQRERIFERFGRGGSGDSGTGLGLAIARHVAEGHGGSVSVESPVADGAGARFELRFPILSV